MKKNKIDKESKSIETARDKGVNSTDMLYAEDKEELDPAVDGTFKDYLFGNLRALEEFIKKLNRDNIDEISRKLDFHLFSPI